MTTVDHAVSLRFSRPPSRTWTRVEHDLLKLETSVIQADAEVRIMPQSMGEILQAGWKIGFIQLQLEETNWAYYRGSSNEDGAMLVDSGGTGSRSNTICRDTEREGMIWYTGAGAADSTKETRMPTPTPWSVPMFYFGDQPSGEMRIEQRNPQTGKTNILEEARLKLSFLTTLTLRNPAMSYRHLYHFYWTVHWHARRQATGPVWGGYPMLPGSGSTLSTVVKGPPKDPTQLEMLTDETRRARCCNEIASIATMHPIIRSSRTWERFSSMK